MFLVLSGIFSSSNTSKRVLFVYNFLILCNFIHFKGRRQTLIVVWAGMEAFRNLYLSMIISIYFSISCFISYSLLFPFLRTLQRTLSTLARHILNDQRTLKETYMRKRKSSSLTAPTLSSPHDSGSGVLTCVSVVFQRSSNV